jgi:hypothetical protein
VSGQVLDVVLTPGSAPDASGPSTFSTAFKPMSASSISTTSSTTSSADSTASDVAPVYEDPAPGEAPAYVDATSAYTAPAYEPIADVAAAPAAVAVVATPAGAEGPSVLRTAPAAVALPPPEGFQYAIVLVLPLLLLAGCSYVGWALTQPVSIKAGDAR